MTTSTRLEVQFARRAGYKARTPCDPACDYRRLPGAGNIRSAAGQARIQMPEPVWRTLLR